MNKSYSTWETLSQLHEQWLEESMDLLSSALIYDNNTKLFGKHPFISWESIKFNLKLPENGTHNYVMF